MDASENGFEFGHPRVGHTPEDETALVDGVPTSRRGQSCAFCAASDVVWVHPLATKLVRYRQNGEEHTLPTFWALCDRCESIYNTGNAQAAIEVMRSSDGWSWVTSEDVAECIEKPLEVFRRADMGARPLAE